MNVMSELFQSKRFVVSLLATAAAVFLCTRGLIHADQLADTVTKIAMALTVAYGVENAALAHGASFPQPQDTDPGPSPEKTIYVPTYEVGKTPAETPNAKQAEKVSPQ